MHYKKFSFLNLRKLPNLPKVSRGYPKRISEKNKKVAQTFLSVNVLIQFSITVYGYERYFLNAVVKKSAFLNLPKVSNLRKVSKGFSIRISEKTNSSTDIPVCEIFSITVYGYERYFLKAII
ncbi:MAG TPA: hypothetical protein PLU67_01095 [Candidatus Kapabacteria bacterium]|nr:hypothetical protein [Candidatus Kapabacteria bacterium]